jgi:hypothetical protein
MKRWTPIKVIAWLPIAIGVGLVAASPASAAPFNASQAHRAEARADIIKVDHRYDRRQGRRYRDYGYRRGHRAPPRWRHRRYRDRYVVRRHGHRYRGYGHHRRDAAAYDWLAFTAITVKLLDVISVSQQRAHETAQIRATTAPVGDTVYWNQGNAQGAVTAVRDGQSTAGRYCREFQQVLTVGGKTESAYGTACRQPDGSWELMR